MLESTWVECVAFPDRELAASRSVQHRLPSLHRLPIVLGEIAIGLGKIAVVFYGIRTMEKMSEERAREADDRHLEAMPDLHELIRFTAPSYSR